MKLVRFGSNLIYKIEMIIVCILVPVMAVSLFLDVVYRYVLNAPLIWAQEISLFTFIWAGFIGASMSIKIKEAVAVNILVDNLKGPLRNILITLGLFISTIFLIVLTYLSIIWILNPTILTQKSVTTQIPMLIPYLSIPISLIFMSIHLVYLSLEALYGN